MKMKFPELQKNIAPSCVRGLSILLVDNGSESLMYHASMLEHYSFKVTTAQLATVALSMIEEEGDRFKLVIADANLPDMDTHEFLQVLVKKNLPVIFMFAETDRTATQNALSEGASFCLHKPVSLEEMKYIWQHYIRHKSAAKMVKEIAAKETKFYRHGRKVEKGDLTKHKIVITKDFRSPPSSQNTRQGDTSTKGMQFEYWQGTVTHYNRYELKGIKAVMVDDQSKLGESGQEQGGLMNNLQMKEEGKVAQKGKRIVWTDELQQKFIQAIYQLVNETLRPRKILKLMNVPDLTQRQVASHLQKYKSRLKNNSHNLYAGLETSGKNLSSYMLGIQTPDFGAGSGNPDILMLSKQIGDALALEINASQKNNNNSMPSPVMGSASGQFNSAGNCNGFNSLTFQTNPFACDQNLSLVSLANGTPANAPDCSNLPATFHSESQTNPFSCDQNPSLMSLANGTPANVPDSSNLPAPFNSENQELRAILPEEQHTFTPTASLLLGEDQHPSQLTDMLNILEDDAEELNNELDPAQVEQYSQSLSEIFK